MDTRTILPVAGLLLYIAVVWFLMVPMIRGARRQKLQGRWPRVDALVTEHRLRREQLTGFREFRVAYEYAGTGYDRWVGVADGTGHSLVVPPSGMRPEEALRRRMAKHPVGSRLAVMVNPDDVEQAYFVEREFPIGAFAIGAGVVFLGFFAMLLYVALA